ncbi:MAG: glycogen synthase [Chromatiales bacterium]|nr:glycogen synthase [Chromatiales bacterium]
MRPLRILMVSAELAPWAKTGGLADMVAGLAQWLHGQGHDVRLLLPGYRFLPAAPGGMPVGGLLEGPVRTGGTYPGWQLLAVEQPGDQPPLYLVDAPGLLGDGPLYGHGDDDARRFALLCHAVPRLIEQTGWQPDIVHMHDWHAAPAGLLLEAWRNPAPHQRPGRLLTIHNIGYQGDFDRGLSADCGFGALEDRLDDGPQPDPRRLNFLRTGIIHADALTTVSPSHAGEILGPMGGMGLEAVLRERQRSLHGILNGVDYRCWDPGHDPLIPARYSLDRPGGKQECRQAFLEQVQLDLDPGVPLLGMVTRLASHKGIDLVLEALPPLLAQGRLGAVILGSGEPGLEGALLALSQQSGGRLRFIKGHDEALAHRVFAAADLFAVPSLYEPCGLTQMYAMRYGAIPVVRATGGLRDSVHHFDPSSGQGTGSVFEHADAAGLSWAIETALGWLANPELASRLRSNAMQADFSWDRQGPGYVETYLRLLPE